MPGVDVLLGLPGLVQTCVHGYRSLLMAKNFSKDAGILHAKLRIQEARLIRIAHGWGVHVSGSEDDVSVAVRHVPQGLVGTMDQQLAEIFSKLVKDVMDQIASVLTDSAKLTVRYGLKAEAESDSPEPRSKVSLFLAPMYRKRQSSPLRRLQWTVVDRAAFADLISHLSAFNDALEQFVPSRQRQDLNLALPIQFAGIDDLEELEYLRAASHKYQALQQVLDLKTFRIKLNDTGANASLVTLRKDSSLVTLSEPAAPTLPQQRCRAKFKEEGVFGYKISDVLIEWKAYDDQKDTKRKEIIAERVAALASLLNRSEHARYLKVLPCLGYFEDERSSRFGYILRPPHKNAASAPSPGARGSNQPHPESSAVSKTLYSMLGQEKAASCVPDLGSRFSLALNLSRTLLQLHAAGWLHKGLRSDNVLFFDAQAHVDQEQPSGQMDVAPDISDPVLAGFEYSRPDTEMAVTETLTTYSQNQECYRHPATISAVGAANPVDSRFRREFDVYSLGCVLLEIGLWRRIEEFWKDRYKAKPSAFRDRLLQRISEDLARTCGKTYQGVVQLCLSMGKHESEASRGQAVSQKQDLDDYYYNIVCKLQSCSV